MAATTTGTLRIGMYARVSSERQEREQTIESQVDLLRKYAVDLGATVVHDGAEDVFRDDGYTGGNLDRPAIARLRARLAAGDLDAVMAYDLDRISRDQADLFQVDREIAAGGAVLFLAKERRRFGDGDEDMVLKSAFAMVAQLERRRIGERARRGGERRARVEGRKNGGIPAFGFRLSACDCGATVGKSHAGSCAGGRYQLDEGEVAHLRQMSSWLLAGITPGVIARRLTEMLVPTRYDTARIARQGSTRKPCTWYPDQVRKMLTDDLYGGLWRYQPGRGGDPVVKDVPVIFDAPTLEAHRRQIARNRSLKARTGDRVFLLRSLVTCGQCGRRYVAGMTAAKNRDQGIYRCGVWHHQRHLRNCTNKGWTARRLEGIVWGEVERLILEPATVLEELARRGRSADRPDLHLAQLRRSLADHAANDERIVTGYVTGFLSPSEAEEQRAKVAKARALIESELATAERQVAEAAAAERRAETLTAALSHLRGRLPKLTDQERADVLQQVVTRITVTGEEVEIELVLGDPKKGNRRACPRSRSCGTPPSPCHHRRIRWSRR